MCRLRRQLSTRQRSHVSIRGRSAQAQTAQAQPKPHQFPRRSTSPFFIASLPLSSLAWRHRSSSPQFGFGLGGACFRFRWKVVSLILFGASLALLLFFFFFRCCCCGGRRRGAAPMARRKGRGASLLRGGTTRRGGEICYRWARCGGDARFFMK